MSYKSYKHSICDELGETNSASDEKRNFQGHTLYAHSTLVLDANKKAIGFAYQDYWYRNHKQTANKICFDVVIESCKWQNNVE